MESPIKIDGNKPIKSKVIRYSIITIVILIVAAVLYGIMTDRDIVLVKKPSTNTIDSLTSVTTNNNSPQIGTARDVTISYTSVDTTKKAKHSEVSSPKTKPKQHSDNSHNQSGTTITVQSTNQSGGQTGFIINNRDSN